MLMRGWCWGRNCIHNGVRNHISMLEINVLILVAIKQLYPFVKTQKAGHLKWVSFTSINLTLE